MKLNKIFAVMAATAIAGSMAISASAADLGTRPSDGENFIYNVDFTGYTGEDLEKVVKVEAEIDLTSDYCNGCIGGNINGAWAKVDQETSASGTDVWTMEIADGGLANYVLDEETNEVSSQPYMEVQLWWVNPLYDDDGNEAGVGVCTLKSVKFIDADGNEVVPSSNADTDKDTDTDTETPAEKNDGDTSTSTGLAGLSLAGLAVAGAAVVASKKKN